MGIAAEFDASTGLHDLTHGSQGADQPVIFRHGVLRSGEVQRLRRLVIEVLKLCCCSLPLLRLPQTRA
jgi:hypothetical protein